jgi:hypothetical protein
MAGIHARQHTSLVYRYRTPHYRLQSIALMLLDFQYFHFGSYYADYIILVEFLLPRYFALRDADFAMIFRHDGHIAAQLRSRLSISADAKMGRLRIIR